MLIVRGIAALGVSAVIAVGTLVAVNNSTDKANETAKEITKQSLQYQKDIAADVDKATKNAADTTKTAEERTADIQADTDAIIEKSNEAAEKAIENVEDNVAIPAEAQDAIDAAKAQIEASK